MCYHTFTLLAEGVVGSGCECDFCHEIYEFVSKHDVNPLRFIRRSYSEFYMGYVQ
jgi:hypothetical protein